MPDSLTMERPRISLAPAPELKPTVDVFPDVIFPRMKVEGAFGFKFALKNDEDRAKASRAVEAAKKVLSDAGAEMTVVFDPPAQQ